jgi:hypothetical protein
VTMILSQKAPDDNASHPEGMQEGSQGQAKRSPWNVPRKTRAP